MINNREGIYDALDSYAADYKYGRFVFDRRPVESESYYKNKWMNLKHPLNNRGAKIMLIWESKLNTDCHDCQPVLCKG